MIGPKRKMAGDEWHDGERRSGRVGEWSSGRGRTASKSSGRDHTHGGIIQWFELRL